MNKKTYTKPSAEVITVNITHIICEGSPFSPNKWAGDLGQVPNLNITGNDIPV